MDLLFDLDQPQVSIVQDELMPQVGEYWKVRNGRDYLFAIVTSEVPLEVRYFEPCAKKGFLCLNDTIFEAFLQDLNEKIHPPESIQMGKRVFYSFDLINV